jgi:hypothetical protein
VAAAEGADKGWTARLVRHASTDVAAGRIPYEHLSRPRGPKVRPALVREWPKRDDRSMRRVIALIALGPGLLIGACGGAGTLPPVTATPSQTVGPTATGVPTATVAATTVPSPSPTAAAVMLDHAVVYFARDRMPPVAAHVDGAGAGATIEARVLSRLAALSTTAAPRGLFNVALNAKARPAAVTVTGDQVIADFAVPAGDWGVAGSAGTRAFIQQVVYTATEEPGIRSALITENGRQAIIGGEGVVIDHPATREDVAGYRVRAGAEPMIWRAATATPVTITSRLSVDAFAPALTRFVVDTGLRGADAKGSLGFTVSVAANDERSVPGLGKWILAITLPGTRSDEDPWRVVERTPLRAVRTTSIDGTVRYDLGLDDLRPWRVAMLYEPLRLVVDVGGDPDAVSANIALYRPAFGATVRAGDELSGLVRAFEARFEYRIQAVGNVLVNDFATASLGTSEMWGGFTLPLPALPAGAATIEILLHSPRDGSISESVFTSVEVVR